MSVYFAPNGAEDGVLDAVAAELQRDGASTEIFRGEPSFVWVDWDAPRFGPAYDPVTGVRVVLSGRLALSPSRWAELQSLKYEGGIAARDVLDAYLTSGPDAVAPYNGAAAIIIFDPRSRKVTLWTDQFGYHPCFIYDANDPRRCVITTFPDLILCDPTADAEFDLVAMAEFLRAWRTTPPHTYYRSIKHAGAAGKTVFDLARGTIERSVYWRPFETEFFPNVDAAGEALAAAVTASVRERTAISQRAAFMVSGGADSRVLLFAATHPERVTGINLYERHAAETQIARELCERAGARFQAFQRDAQYYPRLLPEIVRWSGAMWSAEDSHYLGFAEQIKAIGADLVMTACTTDWLFKGYGLDKAYVTLFGKALPFFRFFPTRQEGFLPNHPTAAPPELAEAVAARLEAWFSDVPTQLATPRDRLLVEDKRTRPTAYAVSVSGGIMSRTYPYDTFLADSRVAECYSRIEPAWKLNRVVWGKAAARICASGGRIVDANYGWPVDASTSDKMLRFALGWVKRRMRPAQSPEAATESDDRAPSSGSWPDYGWYAANSPLLFELWRTAPPEHRDRMRYIAGEDPWDRPLTAWRSDGHRLMRMSTLLAHWRECEQRQARIAAIRLKAALTY